MLRIDAAQELVLVEAERDRVVGLTLTGRPGRLLPCEDGSEATEVGEQLALERHVEGEKAGLVAEELAHGKRFFPLLRELGPIARDGRVVVEPAA